MDIIQKLKALGDETRLRIINALRQGPLCVCELESILEITQSNVSRHLNKLMNAGLVTYYKEAKFVYYKIDETSIKEYRFVETIINNDLEPQEIFEKDNLILKEYRNLGLGCESVSQIKEVVANINNRSK